MQVVAYYQYLNGDRPGTGPAKEELLLRVAQRTTQRSGNPIALHAAMAKLPGASDFCKREPHLEGEEVFGSLKRKLDLPPGCEEDSHRPDKINFSRPRVQTRQRISRHREEASPEVQVHEDTNKDQEASHDDVETFVAAPPRPHVIVVQETVVDETHWHIARLPKTSAKACFAQQANTKKKCIAKIVQDGKNTAAPTYRGMMDNYKKDQMERMQFFFCNDDIERCVKGTRRKWVVSKPTVPKIWPVKMGTNLTSSEILALENAGFQLQPRVALSPQRLFEGQGIPNDLSRYIPPEFLANHPKRRFGKNICRNAKAPSTKQANVCASALLVTGRLAS